MYRIAVVIPCFNEAARLSVSKYIKFLNMNPDTILCFVNDGSSDTTIDILHQIANTCPNTKVLSLKSNCGKAEAVRVGMLEMFDANIEYVGYWDADLSTPLDVVSQFVDVMDSNNSVSIVTGARVKLLGRNISRNTFRHYSGRVFATLVSGFLGIDMYDTQCGAKMFRATPMVSHAFQNPFLTRWIFDVEIILRLKKLQKLYRNEGKVFQRNL